MSHTVSFFIHAFIAVVSFRGCCSERNVKTSDNQLHRKLINTLHKLLNAHLESTNRCILLLTLS